MSSFVPRAAWISNHRFDTELAETTAWNFQQGSLLRWNPVAPNDEIIYNSNENGQYKGVILNIKTGEKRFTDRPLANVDSSGNYGLGMNFSRLYDFRPGYGYGEIAGLKWFEVNYPTPYGKINVRAERCGEQAKINISAPSEIEIIR